MQTQLTGFRTLLNNGTNAIVRFWVEAGASYGHQSATANLVYRMARPVGADNLNFGYTGTIEIYYERADDLPKLQQLIPELLLHPPRINAATVQAILWAAAPGGDRQFRFLRRRAIHSRLPRQVQCSQLPAAAAVSVDSRR